MIPEQTPAEKAFHSLSTIERIALRRVAEAGPQTGASLRAHMAEFGHDIDAAQKAGEIHDSRSGFFVELDQAGRWAVKPEVKAELMDMLANSHP